VSNLHTAQNQGTCGRVEESQEGYPGALHLQCVQTNVEVKCDEDLPECYQCVSSGRKCPGALQGTLFIDMSHVVRQNLGNGEEGQVSVCKPQPLPKGTTKIPTKRPLRDSQERDEQLCQTSRILTIYQPKRASAFQELYIGHFMSSVNPIVHLWVTELPNILSGPAEKEEIYAIRAATMALYGKLTGNRDVQVEASAWYLKGLEIQRTKLSVAAEKENYKPCIHGAIGAAVMFSYFENIICTMPMGWMQHCIAAAKMFEVVGPENCQTGLIHMFFRSMRINSVIFPELSDRSSKKRLICSVHHRAHIRQGIGLCIKYMVHCAFRNDTKDAV
jgi:hypothetical protein